MFLNAYWGDADIWKTNVICGFIIMRGKLRRHFGEWRLIYLHKLWNAHKKEIAWIYTRVVGADRPLGTKTKLGAWTSPLPPLAVRSQGVKTVGLVWWNWFDKQETITFWNKTQFRTLALVKKQSAVSAQHRLCSLLLFFRPAGLHSSTYQIFLNVFGKCFRGGVLSYYITVNQVNQPWGYGVEHICTSAVL